MFTGFCSIKRENTFFCGEIENNLPSGICLHPLFGHTEQDIYPAELSAVGLSANESLVSDLSLHRLFDNSLDLDDGDYDPLSLHTSVSCPDLYTTELPVFLISGNLSLGTGSCPQIVPSSCVHTHSRILPGVRSTIIRMVTRFHRSMSRKARGHPGRPP